MREVSNLRVTQIRIYHQDELPFPRLRSKEVAAALQQAFLFGPMQEAIAIAQGPIPAFGFEQGVFSPNSEKVPVSITRLMFDPRRVIVTVEGDSESADSIICAVFSAIAGVRGGVDLTGLQPELTYQESSCDVSLDMGFRSMWSAGLAGFLEGTMFEHLSLRDARAFLGTPSLQIQVHYQITNNDLIASQITLNPGTVTIAAKAGLPLKDHRFTISSPTDSRTHLRIIEQLEAALAEKRR